MNKEWASFYQSNPDKLIEDCLDVKLTWYQKTMMKMVDKIPIVYPKNLGRHNVYEQMELMRKIMNTDKE